MLASTCSQPSETKHLTSLIFSLYPLPPPPLSSCQCTPLSASNGIVFLDHIEMHQACETVRTILPQHHCDST